MIRPDHPKYLDFFNTKGLKECNSCTQRTNAVSRQVLTQSWTLFHYLDIDDKRSTFLCFNPSNQTIFRWFWHLCDSRAPIHHSRRVNTGVKTRCVELYLPCPVQVNRLAATENVPSRIRPTGLALLQQLCFANEIIYICTSLRGQGEEEWKWLNYFVVWPDPKSFACNLLIRPAS